MFSSPASANDLRIAASFPRSSSFTSLHTFPENIEVEKKVELENIDALISFENKIQDAGGMLLDETSFTDCYYDSPELLLTSNNHYLRDREGIWELKVPCQESNRSTSVYEELEGSDQILQYFVERFPHGPIELPFDRAYDDIFGSEEVSEKKTDAKYIASPFVGFTTKRRRWKLEMRQDFFTIDVDEASFGCFLAEFELMVHDHAHVKLALAKIDAVCAEFGVVGAPNQDRASKFVKFILRDRELLARTEAFAPAVLMTN